MQILVTGTEAQVGKTFISAGLATIMQALGYSVSVYKPIQTGAKQIKNFLQAPDMAYIKQIDPFLNTYCTYLFKKDAIPAIAAEFEGTTIDMETIHKDFRKCSRTVDITIVDGIGEILTPISPTMYMADIAKNLELPILLITKADNSSLSNTLLALNYAKSHDIKVAGVIVNMYPETTTDITVRTAPRLIEEYADVKVLGIIKDFGKNVSSDPGRLIDAILNNVDIEEIFKIKIPKLSSF